MFSILLLELWCVQAPGMKYDKDFNAEMGDSNLLFKTKDANYRSSLT